MRAPDPVAVESIAGRVKMPRRLMTVLQSEGLSNDAAAIVIFQADVATTLDGQPFGFGVVGNFLRGAAMAILVGMVIGWVTGLITRLVSSPVPRSSPVGRSSPVALVVPWPWWRRLPLTCWPRRYKHPEPSPSS